MKVFQFLAALFRSRKRTEIPFDISESSYFKSVTPNPVPRESISVSDSFSVEVEIEDGIDEQDLKRLLDKGRAPWKIVVLEDKGDLEAQVFVDTFSVTVDYNALTTDRIIFLNVTGIKYWNTAMRILVTDDMADSGGSSHSEPEYYKWVGNTIEIANLEWTRYSLELRNGNQLWFGDQHLKDVISTDGITIGKDAAGNKKAMFSYPAYKREFIDNPTLPDGWRIPTVNDIHFSIHRDGLHDHAAPGYGMGFSEESGYGNWVLCAYERKKWAEAHDPKGAGDLGDARYVAGYLNGNRLVDIYPSELDPSDENYPKWAYASIGRGVIQPKYPATVKAGPGSTELPTGRRLMHHSMQYYSYTSNKYHPCRDELGLSITKNRTWVENRWGSFWSEDYSCNIWVKCDGILAIQTDVDMFPKTNGNLVRNDAQHVLFEQIRPRPYHYERVDNHDVFVWDYDTRTEFEARYWNSFNENADGTATVRRYKELRNMAYYWSIQTDSDEITSIGLSGTDYFYDKDPEHWVNSDYSTVQENTPLYCEVRLVRDI